MDYIKCNNCKGTGHIPTTCRTKYTVCPICRGTGKKRIRKK